MDGEVVVAVEDAEAVVEEEGGDEGVVKPNTFKHLLYIVSSPLLIDVISSCTYITRA